MKIAPRIMSSILRDNLELTAYKIRTGYFLTGTFIKNRVLKSIYAESSEASQLVHREQRWR